MGVGASVVGILFIDVADNDDDGGRCQCLRLSPTLSIRVNCNNVVTDLREVL